MEEIVKLICKRNMERKILSKEDIKRICNIIIKGKNYEEYVKNIRFANVNPKDEDTAGMYDGEDLFFYGKGLEKFSDVNFDQLDTTMDGTRIDYINFFILVCNLSHLRLSRIHKRFTRAKSTLAVYKNYISDSESHQKLAD